MYNSIGNLMTKSSEVLTIKWHRAIEHCIKQNTKTPTVNLHHHAQYNGILTYSKIYTDRNGMLITLNNPRYLNAQ